jgi:hypothetical protein
MASLLAQHFLDFGNTINDFTKTERDIDAACTAISAIEVQSYYKKTEPPPVHDLREFE